jgi:hypothetical protein
MKNIFIITGCFLLLSMAALGQDWTIVKQEELQKVLGQWSDKMKSANSLKVNMEMTSYENHTTSEYYDKSEGYYIRKGDKVHSFILGAHSIVNESGMWVINDEHKLIFAHGIRKPAEPVDMAFASDQSAISAIDKNPLNGGWIYRVKFKQGLYSAVNIFFNSEGEMGKVIMYMTRTPQPPKADEEAIQPRIEIVFSNYQWNASIDQKESFDISRYFLSSGEKLVLTPQYNGYKLIDNRILN